MEEAKGRFLTRRSDSPPCLASLAQVASSRQCIAIISKTAQAALLGVLLGVSWRRIPGARSWCLAHLPCLVREAALEEVFRLRAGAGRDHRRLVQKVPLYVTTILNPKY